MKELKTKVHKEIEKRYLMASEETD